MNSVKATLKTVFDLEVRLDELWDDLSVQLRAETAPERGEMRKYRNPMITFWVLTVALFLVQWVIEGHWLTLATAIVMAIFAGYNTYKWYEAHDAYALKLNKYMYALVFRFFELEGDYFGDDGEVVEVNADARVEQSLKASELLTEDTDNTTVGDVFKATYRGNDLEVGELKVTRTEGSGKHRRVVTVFHGLFAEYTLTKTLTGTTFISTEGDERGFGHRDFWGRITGKSKVEESELEWNDFENDLHVATSDGTEARYILTPDLMQELHAWWNESKRNIRIVFRENKMCMLFPDSKIKVSSFVATNLVDQKDYAMTIIVPLWHILRLLEDIDKRFK